MRNRLFSCVVLLPFFVACQYWGKQDKGSSEVVFEEPILFVDPAHTRVKRLAGDWSSHDKLVFLEIIDNRFSFRVASQAEKWLVDLDNVVVSLDDEMTFDRSNVLYDLFWVYDEPNRMRLTAKADRWPEIKGITLTRKTEGSPMNVR